MNHIDEFQHWLYEIERLEALYAREKKAAGRHRTRGKQDAGDLIQIWKKTYRAHDLRGDITDAYRNAQTYALAVLAELAIEGRTHDEEENHHDACAHAR